MPHSHHRPRYCTVGLSRSADPTAHLLVNVVDEDRFRTSAKDGGVIGQVS